MAKLLTTYKSIVAKSGKSYKEVAAKSDSRALWKSGAVVTYVVDTSESYIEEVDSGASVLSPTSFTPAKDGWIFVGWREDSVANSSVLTSKIMDADPIALYAVFKQDVTATFTSYAKTETKTTTLYYNNGNVAKGSVTAPTGNTYSGWAWRGWGTSDTANASVAYENGDTVPNIGGNTTLYGLYSQNITVTYYDDSTTAKTKNGVKYYNAAGTVLNPWFTLQQSAKSGWIGRGWGTSDAAYTDMVFTPKIDGYFDSNITIYGLYQQNITLSYDGNGADSGSVSPQTKIRYYNSSGKYTTPSFYLKANGFTKAGYEFTGWDLGAAGATVELTVSTTAKAQWKILAVPYTVNLGDYPMTMTDHGADSDTGGVFNYASSYVLEVTKDENSIAYGYVSGSVTYPTQKCNKVRVKVSHTGVIPQINGVNTDSESYTDHYVYLDCSGDTFTLSVHLSNPHTDKHQVTIKEVYFYYE